jgi:transcription elongation factor S-II
MTSVTPDSIRSKVTLELGKTDLTPSLVGPLELAIHHHYPNSSQYLSNTRHLIWNLNAKNNPHFAHKVNNGDFSIQQIPKLTATEIFPEQWQSIQERYKHKLARELEGPEQAVSDLWVCPKCHQKKTTYFQRQMRSSDEPMTTFITCVNCQHRWRNGG